jgi:hypothetical protein
VYELSDATAKYILSQPKAQPIVSVKDVIDDIGQDDRRQNVGKRRPD